jgi:hypothetical protein
MGGTTRLGTARAIPVKRKKRANMTKKFMQLMPMRVLRIEKDDVLVMQTDLFLSKEQVEALRDRATEQFGKQFGKIAILACGLKLGVLRKSRKTR